MLQVPRNMVPPDPIQVCNIITRHNSNLGVCLDYDKILTYYSYYTIVARETRHKLQKYIGYGVCGKMSDDEFLSWLLQRGVREGLGSTQSGAISVSSDSLENAINTGLYSDELNTVMRVKIKLNQAEYAESSLFSYTRYTPVNIPTFDGHRMIVTRPTWSVQNTGRFAMSNPAIQNIAKDLSDINTVPEGWVLYECDSGQIEPKIIYSHFIPDPQIQALIRLYNDAYYGILHYVTMPIEDLVSGTLTFGKKEITEELVALRKQLKKLGNGVMYGKQSNPGNDPLIENYIKRIGGHPERIKWQRLCEDAVDRGQDIFPTVFGTPINIKIGEGGKKYEGNAEALRRHHIRCAINNPIQGTAGDLARYSVMMADHFLTRNCPNSVIVKYTHDSGTFAIHEDEYHKAMPFLKDVTAYQVEGWLPITSDGDEGRSEGLFSDVI